MTKRTTTLDLFITLLAVAFITLKVANVIDWSWVWVLSPIWISVLIALALLPIAIKLKYKQEEAKKTNKYFQERLKKMAK
jgi:hypothetical protein